MGTRLVDPPASLSHPPSCPPPPTGSILSVHSQPADTSHILQLPKDAPHLLQPHSVPTWGTIPKLPPPGRSPLAQRPLRRQVSRCEEVGTGLSAGNPKLWMMTSAATFILPAKFIVYQRCARLSTQDTMLGKAEVVCALLEFAPLPCFTEEAWRPERGQGCPATYDKLEGEPRSLMPWPWPWPRATSLCSVLLDLAKGYKAHFRCLHLWPGPGPTLQGHRAVAHGATGGLSAPSNKSTLCVRLPVSMAT